MATRPLDIKPEPIDRIAQARRLRVTRKAMKPNFASVHGSTRPKLGCRMVSPIMSLRVSVVPVRQIQKDVW